MSASWTASSSRIAGQLLLGPDPLGDVRASSSAFCAISSAIFFSRAASSRSRSSSQRRFSSASSRSCSRRWLSTSCGGLALDLLGLLEELDEDRDLRPEDRRARSAWRGSRRPRARSPGRPGRSVLWKAVRKMIGVCCERSRSRIRAAVSKPSMPGIWTSIRITAKSSSRTRIRASSPERRRTRFRPMPPRIASRASRLLRLVVHQQDVDLRARTPCRLSSPGRGPMPRPASDRPSRRESGAVPRPEPGRGDARSLRVGLRPPRVASSPWSACGTARRGASTGAARC